MRRCIVHPVKKGCTKTFIFEKENIEISVCDFCYNELNSRKICHAEVLELAQQIMSRDAERVLYSRKDGI